MPKLGPSEGSRTQTTVLRPIRLSASPRPIVVVVFPSPAGVGLMAVTRIRRPSGRSCSEAMKSLESLALSWPKGSRCSCGISSFAPISWIGLQDASRAISMSDFTSAIRPALLLAIQNLAQLDKVRAGAKDIEAHCCQMGRHNPTGLAAVGDDEGRDVQGRAELLLGIVPQRVERTLGNHIAEISTRSVQQAVITIELAIGEPEAVIGAEVEPAAIMVLRPLPQDRGGGANVASNAVQELHEVVGAGVEHGIATLQAGIEVAQ